MVDLGAIVQSVVVPGGTLAREHLKQGLIKHGIYSIASSSSRLRTSDKGLISHLFVYFSAFQSQDNGCKLGPVPFRLAGLFFGLPESSVDRAPILSIPIFLHSCLQQTAINLLPIRITYHTRCLQHAKRSMSASGGRSRRRRDR
jgi:hypothetical protein